MIHQAFKRAMDRYGVRGKDLAQLTGLSTTHITQFRNGKTWVTEKTLETLIKGIDELSPGARHYFCQLLAEGNLDQLDGHDKSLIEMIDDADDEEIEAALLAIGRKWKKTRQNQPRIHHYAEELNSAIAF